MTKPQDWMLPYLSDFPDTHMHEWDDEALGRYDLLGDELSVEAWVELDDYLLTNRTCNIKDCDDWHAEDLSPTPPTPSVASDEEIERVLNLDIDLMTQEDWTLYNEWMDEVMKKKQDDLHWQGDSPAAASSVVTVNGKTKGDPCDCDGPPDGKWNSHTSYCPQSPDFGKPKSFASTAYTPKCRHDREGPLFNLQGGLGIRPVAYRDVKYIDSEDLDVGIYLTDSWQYGVVVSPGLDVPFVNNIYNKQVILDWPDMKPPPKDLPLLDIVKWTLDSLEHGQRMEVGCYGAHGRTGTLLACILVAQGLGPGCAISRVRKQHCEDAIETVAQAEYVGEFYKLFHGNETWKKNKKERKLFNKMKDGGKKAYTYTGKSWTSEAPVWNEQLKLWTAKTYRTGYSWNKEHNFYTSTLKDGDWTT